MGSYVVAIFATLVGFVALRAMSVGSWKTSIENCVKKCVKEVADLKEDLDHGMVEVRALIASEMKRLRETLDSRLESSQRRWDEHYRNYGDFIKVVKDESAEWERYRIRISGEIATLREQVRQNNEEILRLRDHRNGSQR